MQPDESYFLEVNILFCVCVHFLLFSGALFLVSCVTKEYVVDHYTSFSLSTLNVFNIFS